MNRRELLRHAKKDFEKTWAETASNIKKPHHDEQYPRLQLKTGVSHPLIDTISKLRQAYLKLGFDEVINPIFIEEEHVYKQFGPEAPAVLDRCFYLSGLPRPDIGLGIDKIEKIEALGVEMDEDKIKSLQEVFRNYKKGKISGDDLVLDISSSVDVNDVMGLRILEKVFPELKDLEPQPSGTTLRSHMTSGWFITLKSIHKKYKLPIKLFSIDRCFRREQKEDSGHLMTYHSASCIWADEEVYPDIGMSVAESLIRQFGFEKFKFLPDEKKSKYYIPTTQTEVYGYHPQLKDWVEVATFGLYSPIALAHYGIEKEVMNLGLGAERLSMLLYNQRDIRELVYPQTYKSWYISDRDLVSMLHMNLYPATEDGRTLMESIISTCKKHGEDAAPCEYVAFDDELLGKKITVKIVEPEDNTKLLGPAAWNWIYVYDGNIVGIPPQSEIRDNKALEAMIKGISTDIIYMDSIAARAAYKVEEMVISGNDNMKLRATIAKSLSDINLRLEKTALHYITSNKKIIDVRGPIFCTITAQVDQ